MVKLSLPFGGKKLKPSAVGKMPATERVAALSKQGFSELEIIRMMRQEGYSPLDVDEGLKESLKAMVAPPREAVRPEPMPRPVEPRAVQPAEPWRPETAPTEMPELPPIERTELGLPRIPGVPAFEPPPAEETVEEYPEAYPRPVYPEEEQFIKPVGRVESGRERELEDLAEVIVDEKMDIVREKIGEFSAKVREMERRIADLEARIEKFGGREQTEVEDLKRKIDEYGNSINNMGTKVESIENVMKDSLQSMLQTMRSLSDAVRSVRGRE